MTIEQEIRAAALQATVTLVAPQLARALEGGRLDWWDDYLKEFRTSVKEHENFIRHGTWTTAGEE